MHVALDEALAPSAGYIQDLMNATHSWYIILSDQLFVRPG